MADTWTPQKRNQNAPLGAPPSAVDQSIFNAIKDLSFTDPESAKALANTVKDLADQTITEKLTTPKGIVQTAAGILAGSNPITSTAASQLAGGIYDVAAPPLSKAYQTVVENSVEYQQKQAADAMRKAGVNPLAKEYASVGDYGVSDLPGTYEENVQKAINEALARAASKSDNAEAAKQSKVDQALMEAISNEIGDYEVNDAPSTEPVGSIKSPGWDALGNKMQGIIDQNALNAQAGAIPGNYSPATSNISKTIESPIDDTVVPNPFADIPTTVPMTIDLSSVFNPATANDKDGDLGQQAPAGGYQSYSGEDVEASYSVPDSKPSGQSSGNWNTVSRQVSTTPSDSGGSSGGK